ncbi:MAG: nucleoside recognition domain-containing protein, partial [Desulfobacteraceae bacterium]
HTWERTWQYIKKAGTVILAISILLWAMMTFPGLPPERQQLFDNQRQAVLAELPDSLVRQIQGQADGNALSEAGRVARSTIMAIDTAEAEAALKNSIAGRMGTGLELVSQWAGFDWRTNIALVGGFAAKEVIVATLGTAYSLGEVDSEQSQPLSQKLADSPKWSPLVALSLMVFVMFYAPCFVAVVCIAREAGSWKWGVFSMAFNTILALALSTALYQFGKLIGF